MPSLIGLLILVVIVVVLVWLGRELAGAIGAPYGRIAFIVMIAIAVLIVLSSFGLIPGLDLRLR